MGNGGRFSTNPLYHFKHILRIANFLLSYLGSKQHANRRRQCYRIIGFKISSVKKPSKLQLDHNLGFKFLDLILLFFSNKINKISTCYKFELSFFNMWISIVVLFFSLWLGMLTRQGGEYSPAPRPHSPTNHPVPDPCCGGFFSPVPIPVDPHSPHGPRNLQKKHDGDDDHLMVTVSFFFFFVLSRFLALYTSPWRVVTTMTLQ